MRFKRLYLRGGKYWYRRMLPVWMSQNLHRIDVRHSLSSSDLIEALSLAAIFDKKIDGVLTLAMAKTFNLDEIPALIHRVFDDLIQGNELIRAAGAYPEGRKVKYALLRKGNCFEKMIASGDYSQPSVFIDKFLEDNGYAYDKDSFDYQSLLREFVKAYAKFVALEDERNKGNYSSHLEEVASPLSSAPPSAVPVEEKPERLVSALIEAYCKEQMDSGKWREKTRAEFHACLETFLFVEGDMDISKLNHTIVMDFREKLKQLPPSRNKSEKLFKLPVEKLLAMKHPKHFTVTSINKHLSRLGSFLEWAIQRDYIQKNYAHRLELKRTQKESEEREAYSKEDILKLCAALRTMGAEKRPDHYWIPLVALFSGMRQTEICQLYKADIVEDSGITCFDINDKTQDKKVKNLSSKRLVPVHPTLIELGFLDYVKSIPAGRRLWEQLSYSSMNGYGHMLQKWYTKFNRRWITKNPKRSFHSFRHSVLDNLKQHMVDTQIIQELAGHAPENITTGRYGKPYQVPSRFEAIKKLDYGVDFLKELKVLSSPSVI